jgi:hypothetical protein
VGRLVSILSVDLKFIVVRQGQFQHLFTPLKVGTMTVPNRISMLGHAAGYFTLDGLPTERAVDYLLARARGGTGLLITGPHHVLPLTSAAPPGPLFSPLWLNKMADCIAIVIGEWVNRYELS